MGSATGQISILFVLILFSAFFSASETALTALNKLRLRHLVEEKVKGADLLNKLVDNPSKLLGTILVGNNIVNIAAASLATTIAISYFGTESGPLIATLIMTPIILIFGEITPKSCAAKNSEKISFMVRNLINFIIVVLSPIVTLLMFVTNGIVKLLGIKSDAENAFITEEEIKTMVNVGQEEGIIEDAEKQMIYNVFEFGDSQVDEIMVPRTEMVTVEVNATFDEVFEVFKQTHVSRLPVYEETIDNIIGFINIKDIILFDKENNKFDILDYIREPYFTFEFKSTAELFSEMKSQGVSVAIVLDEYGGTAGLITIKDLVQEIVGDLKDEHDECKEEIEIISEYEYLVDGLARIDLINEVIETNIESEDFDSIGGFVFGEFGRLPEEGETTEYNDIKFIVESVDKNRINKLRIINNPNSKC